MRRNRSNNCSCYTFRSVYVCALCVRALVRACVHLSGFVLAITSTFMHGFQKHLAQFFSEKFHESTRSCDHLLYKLPSKWLFNSFTIVS